MSEHSKDFAKHLHDEKLRTQEARSKYVTQKLAYATALLGLGSLKVGNVDLSLLLFAVPFLALAFDLYILGEDYSVKRIGAFLSAASSDPLERRWEIWVARNRDPFAPFSLPLLTTVLVGAAALLLKSQGFQPIIIGVWGAFAAAPIWVLYFYYKRMKGKALKTATATAIELSDAVPRLRSAIEDAEHVLTQRAYDAVKQFFLSVVSPSGSVSQPERLSPEYGMKEYFYTVDAKGMPSKTTSAMINSFQRMIQEYPEFALWLTEGSEEALLVARWLCHLAGFRHASAHLFLEVPERPGEIILQIRGLDKAEAPGCFDLPVAGHIEGMQRPDEAVLREAKEELSLEPDSLDLLCLIGSYEYRDSGVESWQRNIEMRHVFRAVISKDRFATIKIAEGEVAGIAVVPINALESLIAKFPERLASGIRASLPFYIRFQSRGRGAQLTPATDG